MTGFLGYHPDRVLALRRALAAALADGRPLRCDDPLAAEAAGRWIRALQLLAPWEARLASILDCGFDTPYRRAMAAADLPVDYLRPVDRAWTVVTDPLSAPLPEIDALARVDEILALLLALDPDQLTPDAVLRFDAILAAVFNHREANRRFFAALGPDGFAGVAAGLARLQVGDTGDPSGPAAGATVVMARLALGLGLAQRRGAVDDAAYRDALLEGASGDPYVAAAVLRHARFPTPITAAWALAITDRSVTAALRHTLGSFVAPGAERTPELVLGALTADPAAGRMVLMAREDLDLLLGPHIDGRARGQFLLATADRHRFTTESTLPIMVKVLGYLDDHRGVASSTVGPEDLHVWLGDYVGPHLLDLIPTADQPVALWDGRDAPRVISWIAESPPAAVVLTGWITRTAELVTTSASVASTPTELFQRLDVVSVQLGVAIGAVERGVTMAAAHAHTAYGQLTGALSVIAGQFLGRALDGLFPGSGFVAGLGLGWLTDRVLDTLEANDWFDEPLSERERASQMERLGGKLQIGAMQAAALASHRHLVVTGQLPATSPPPRAPSPDALPSAYRGQLDRWARTGSAGQTVIADAAGAVHDGIDTGRTIGRGERDELIVEDDDLLSELRRAAEGRTP